jgi:hypothetical protein
MSDDVSTITTRHRSRVRASYREKARKQGAELWSELLTTAAKHNMNEGDLFSLLPSAHKTIKFLNDPYVMPSAYTRWRMAALLHSLGGPRRPVTATGGFWASSMSRPVAHGSRLHTFIYDPSWTYTSSKHRPTTPPAVPVVVHPRQPTPQPQPQPPQPFDAWRAAVLGTGLSIAGLLALIAILLARG